MKIKSILVSLVLGAGLTASSLLANTVVITQTQFNGAPNAGGGEFKAVTSNDGTFLTFCMEKNIAINSSVYQYTFDGNKILSNGGILSQGSALLFRKFSAGSLVDSDGVGNYNDNRDLNAGLLQQAFWMLDSGVAGTNFYTDLVNNNKADYTGSKVEVMNVWGQNSRTGLWNVDKQSQLHLVPDSGVTVALLGLGMLSLAIFRRKL